jgi:hypothetical protein
MSRSPLAYPLNRTADTDAGGAADLQTDIMRFMAILSMCLLAIFALVQSIPLTPVGTTEVPIAPASEPPTVAPQAKEQPSAIPVTEPARPEKPLVLTRPKWVPKYTPAQKPVLTPAPQPVVTAAPQPVVAKAPPPAEQTPPAEPPEDTGFTLRFASDAALMRAVAAQHVGLYAIESGRARRMTVSESRISFWDASTPNTFHEMETGTVPLSVIEALDRAGAETEMVSWGVTLPGRMKTQLDELLQAHRGGSLIITADGDIHWEAS